MAQPPDTTDELAWVNWVQGELRTPIVEDFFKKTQGDIVDNLNRNKAIFTMAYPHPGMVRIVQMYALVQLTHQLLCEIPASVMSEFIHRLIYDTLAGKLDPPSQSPPID